MARRLTDDAGGEGDAAAPLARIPRVSPSGPERERALTEGRDVRP